MIELLQKYKEAKDEVEEDATELDDITPMDIERVNNVYYAYSAEGEFLAQGNDFRSMFENIKNRFPNKSFKIGKYQPNLTEEETGKLVKSIFEVFGNDKTLNK